MRKGDLYRWCEQYKVQHNYASGYPETTALANIRGLRTTNGMHLHLPHIDGVSKSKRIYLVWSGHSEEEFKEAVAYCIMAYPHRPHIVVLHNTE